MPAANEVRRAREHRTLRLAWRRWSSFWALSERRPVTGTQ